MSARETKYIAFDTSTFPAGYAYNLPDNIRHCDISLGTWYDGAIAVNAITGLRVYITESTLIGVADGPFNPSQLGTLTPSIVMQGTQQKYFDYDARFNLVFVFYVLPSYSIIGKVHIELTVNTW